jgi:glycosyltransferase involved in cell wall biosynthesis
MGSRTALGISAVVITLNEEANIERCLASLAFADEIVVLDSFSADRTVEIARRFTDTISQREFAGYSDQKNAAMELASNDWVLVVDADEVVSDQLAAEIRKAVESDRYVAYRMPRLSYFCGKPIRHCGWYPDYVTKLMRRSKSRYPDRLVHETPEIDGPVGTMKSDLLHYTYRDLDELCRKMIAHSRAAARQKIQDGERFRLSKLVFAPGLAFLKKYVVKQGFRDGLRGFVICAMTQVGVFLRYAMLWEMSVRKERD